MKEVEEDWGFIDDYEPMSNESFLGDDQGLDSLGISSEMIVPQN